MTENITAAVKIEITVVGHVDDRILVRRAGVRNDQLVLFQFVGDGHGDGARKSLIHIRAVQGEGDGGVCVLCDGPDPFGILVKTAVQAILSVVFIQGICTAVQSERGAADPVGTAAHVAAEAGGILFVAGDSIKTQDHVDRLSVFVRHKQVDKDRSKVRDTAFQIFVFYGVQMRLYAVFCLPKIQYVHIFLLFSNG